jgi:hypothetical protein
LASSDFILDKVDVFLLQKAYERKVDRAVELYPLVCLKVQILRVSSETTLMVLCILVNLLRSSYNALAKGAKVDYLESIVIGVYSKLQVW